LRVRILCELSPPFKCVIVFVFFIFEFLHVVLLDIPLLQGLEQLHHRRLLPIQCLLLLTLKELQPQGTLLLLRTVDAQKLLLELAHSLRPELLIVKCFIQAEVVLFVWLLCLAQELLPELVEEALLLQDGAFVSTEAHELLRKLALR
jgi:hypothetical protein